MILRLRKLLWLLPRPSMQLRQSTSLKWQIWPEVRRDHAWYCLDTSLLQRYCCDSSWRSLRSPRSIAGGVYASERATKVCMAAALQCLTSQPQLDYGKVATVW